jgi:hypothetical protein
MNRTLSQSAPARVTGLKSPLFIARGPKNVFSL